MKIIEITGFFVKFSFDINQPAIFDLSKKINYGGGSIYQKFKNITPDTLHEDLKSIKDVDFFMTETMVQSFKFTVIEQDFEKVRHFSKVIVKLFKEIHGVKDPVNFEIEQKMVVTDTALQFNI